MTDAFVGRRAELTLLAGECELAMAGRPRLVLIEGPEGIGKTTLVRRAVRAAAPHRVLRASGEEMESSLAYGVMAQLQVTAGAAPPPQEADPLAVGASALDTLGTLQDGGLVIVLVDDAQWADTASLRALTFAFRRLRTDRVLGIVITRDAAESRFPDGLNRLLAGPGANRLKLGGLSTAELTGLGRHIGIQGLSAEAASRLREHTGGNPLYTRAILHQLPPAALTGFSEPLPAPRAYAHHVITQLDTCLPSTIQLIRAASVLGVTCPLGQAARLAGLDDPLDALQEAVSRRLLEHRFTTGEAIIVFPHPLVRAAVYQGLGPHERITLHRRAALFAEHTAARLQHRLRACDGEDNHLSVEFARFARDQVATGQWDSAAEYLSHAVRLAADEEKPTLIAETVDAMVQCGRLRQAAALASSLPWSRAETRTDRSTRAFVHGIVAHLSGQTSKAQSLLTDAWRHCAPNTQAALARRIAGQLAMVCLVQIDGPGTEAWATRALKLSNSGTDDDLLHYARTVGTFLCDRSPPASTTMGTFLCDRSPPTSTIGERGTILGKAGVQLFVDKLAPAYHDLTALVQAGGPSIPFRLLTTVTLSQVEFVLGRWDDALARATVAISIEADCDQFWTQPFAHVVAATIHTHRGEQEQAATHLSAARLHPPHHSAQQYISCAEAALAASRDDPEAVVAALTPLAERASDLLERQVTMTTWSDLLVDAQVTLGRTDDARAVLEVFQRFATASGRPSHLAALERARARLLTGLGETGLAQRALEKALEHARASERPFERALVDLSLGAALRRAGRRGTAAHHLKAAHEIMNRLGALPYVLRCERELIACGHTVAPPKVHDNRRLTPQEHAVAGLVTTGLTNRQIARELMLSVKTIEYHLGNIYAKRGVSSRAELTARHRSN